MSDLTSQDRALQEVLRKQSPPPFWVSLFIKFFKFWFAAYDCLNYLPYALFNSPAEKLRKSSRIKARPLIENDNGSVWRNVMVEDDQLITEIVPNCDTVDKLWESLVTKYVDADCLGTREVLQVHFEKQPNGRIFEKFELGDYYWQSYAEVDDRVKSIGAGLAAIGHERNQNLAIFAETCAEWLIAALACFQCGYPVVTVYATLAEDAIAHAINVTNATTLVISWELLPRMDSVLSRCSSLQRAIFLPPLDPEVDQQRPNLGNLQIFSFDQLEDLGDDSPVTDTCLSPDDLALIMFTSGTTGLPKGVMISHANVVATIAGMNRAVPIISDSDTYIAFLPLAHILEVDAELTCLTNGCRIGYSSPLTLTDRGSKVKKGTHGDCHALRPTLLAAVPAIMDRIFKAVSDEVASSSRIMQEFFRLIYERKRNRLEEGYDSPFLNRLVFKRIRDLLGGNIKAVLSGGARLSSETQRFMNICFCCPVFQGYGLTETCGAGTIADVDDLTTGTVGPPVLCCDIKLKPWDEGNYTPENDPPQGEVLITGPSITLGYWNEPGKTAEDYIQFQGRRWFATGDIGEFRADGSLRIIDRKKDLIKLSHGEYVSLSRVESHLLSSPLVDNVCVFGNFDHAHLVALIVPNQSKLEKLACDLNVHSSSWTSLCTDERVNEAILKQLSSHAQKCKLHKMEIPTKIYLIPDIWTPDSGLLTEALKLKRRPIEQKYANELARLYE